IRAQREMTSHDADLVAVHAQPLDEEVEVGDRADITLLVRRRVDALRAEVLAQPLEQRCATRLLQVHEEKARGAVALRCGHWLERSAKSSSSSEAVLASIRQYRMYALTTSSGSPYSETRP